MRKLSARLRPLVRCFCAVVCVGGFADAQEPAPSNSGNLKIEKLSHVLANGEQVSYEVGTIHVPENRADPASRQIGVGFLRIAAEKPTAPPIFRLPGGPGSSLVSAFEDAKGPRREAMFADFARHRVYSDVVIVDQRGFSSRGDKLIGTLRLPARPKDRPVAESEFVAVYKQFAQSAVTEQRNMKVDLRGYTVRECAHDVDDLRRALGYDKITLMGTSFGSQWSFAVMRLHPKIVVRALLSGVEPLNHGYDMPSHVFAAAQRMWRTLEKDDRFKPFLPTGGIAEAARIVQERLERKPMEVTRTDPATKATKVVGVLGPGDLPWKDPVQILELYHGRFDGIARRMESASQAASHSIPVIGPLIDTSLGVTPERRYLLWNDPAVRYVGRGNFAPGLATADVWPTADVGDAFRNPELCEIPVVFAQGDWDTSTPVENTYEIAPYFVNSRVLIAERGGHGVLQPIARELPEVWKTLEEFLRTGDMESIPDRIQLRASRRFAPPDFKVPPKMQPFTAGKATPASRVPQAPNKFQVEFATTVGVFVLELHRDWAPIGVDRFHELVRKGFFQNLAFFRVIPNFMVQFGIHGDPKISRQWKGASLVDDPVQESNTRGTISFATAGPNTRTTQLFINFKDNSQSLDRGFAPIGKVVKGMEVVDRIHKTGEGAPAGPGPSQNEIQRLGNEYLKKNFPKLDYILSATIVPQ